jgi:beta-N-acetylhexosaminidase
VTRLEGSEGSSYPGNAALGAVDDVELTERVARVDRRRARCGRRRTSTSRPVADVNVEPGEPVIGVRSFGADAALVARHVAAFVRGLQSPASRRCAKHFPGHGATDARLAPRAADGRRATRRRPAVPFRAAIEAGVQSIMTAHVRVAGLGDAPGDRQSRACSRLLREELGYEGVVIADALEMKAFSETVGVEEGAVRALQAGVDALIVGRDLGEDAVRAVQRALARRRGVSEERLAEAAGTRAARPAAWAGSARPADVDAAAGARPPGGRCRAEGDVVLDRPAESSSSPPRRTSPPGRRTHSLAGPLRRPDGERSPAAVLVVPRRAPPRWMRERVDAHPSAIVVEIGLPLWRPPLARGYVATVRRQPRRASRRLRSSCRAEVPA